MVHVLLLILKILGIILLGIIAIGLLVLFFPVRYRGNINIDRKQFDGGINAWWLFHVLSFRFEFDNEDWDYALKFLGIKIIKRHEEVETKGDFLREDISTDKTDIIKDVSDIKERSEKSDSTQEVEVFEKNTEKKQKKNNSFKRFIKKMKRAWKSFVSQVRAGVRGLKEIYERVVYYKKLLTSKVAKRAYKKGKEYIIKLSKHLFPKKIKGNLNIGFDEPHITGQVLGGIAIFYGMFNIDAEKMEINPDFEKEVLKGKLNFKGRGFVCIVLYYVIKFYFDRDIRRVLNKLK